MKSELDPGRAAAERRGRRAETIAGWLLRLKGYRILARRFRGPIGEIDLVAKRGRILAFVEVKARAENEDGLEAVGAKARARIARAADVWLQRYPGAAKMQLRFDIVVVRSGFSWPHHLCNAFGDGGAL